MDRLNLKFFRMQQHLTQQEMADKLKISKSHYVSIENGTGNPSVQILERFGKVFDYDDVWTLFKKGAN